ncbi:MAG: glycosyltransferase family 2 protein [Chloroflexi bacterium]|nr:glycosyltransferase family 2 protein [Chloroflexota bacterium]MCC6893121.1 glycosyltransferase family 2 protein [Anaerolineae bacterium]
MVDLSIIIVNWNGKDLLAKCLRCVESTVKRVSYETVVVDNASTDGSQDMVRRDFPNVKLIANKDNVGFATANNQAMKVVEGRYVLLLNSDAFVHENTLDTMVTFMDEHPQAGMSSCKLLYEDGSLQRSCATFPTLATEFYIALGLDKLFPKSKVFGKYLMTDWDYDTTRQVDVIMGAFMMVRRELISKIGMMDEAFFMYSEEVDWCYRFKQAGSTVYFYPDVTCVHLWGGSSKAVKVESLLRLYRARVQFFRKHYGRLSAFLYKMILGFNALVRVGPGALYYLTRGNPASKQKHYAFRQLLRAIPEF